LATIHSTLGLDDKKNKYQVVAQLSQKPKDAMKIAKNQESAKN
jgi:hypothetical protein